VDSAEGMATLDAMSGHRHGQGNKLILEPPIAAPDEHARLVEADQLRLFAKVSPRIASTTR